MRRLPIYILLDTSGSMQGEPIEAVKTGLLSLLSSLRKDPYALETVWVSIITFDLEAVVRIPLTEVSELTLPEIPVPETSPTNLGSAIELLCDQYRKEIVISNAQHKGDWLPLAIIMTDGAPSDTQHYNRMLEQLKNYKFARIICCAAGPKAKVEPLKCMTKDVFTLDTMDSGTFSKFWVWVSTAVERQSQLVDLQPNELPPPPEEIKLVI
ncbi:MAG: VWA domain-containing protein [Planctomycetia bacterium]|nr:VWA domain-containing protein [Planctomycetia bacterium]